MGELRSREMIIDPITRVAGHLSIRVVVDIESKRPRRDSVRSYTTAFRGFEVFSIGRPPEDLPHILSRFCGVCGGAHANASTLSVDMAYGVTPKPMGVTLRNLGYVMTDHIYDHPTILALLEGPDYSEAVVSKLTPKVYEEAKKTLAEHRDIHGFTTIADIMREFNPITGKIWQLAIKYQRFAKEAGVLIYGRFGHPSTLIPGGIGTDLSVAEYLLMEYIYRLVKLTAWIKYYYPIWEDLMRFYENIGYADNGLTYDPPNAMSVGLFDDPEAYSAIGDYVGWEEIYKNIDEVAAKRIIKPGLVIRGELVTTKPTDISVSTMEHVERSFYEDWADKVKREDWYVESDPLGNKLLWGKYDPVYHPWNKVTIPKLTARSWGEKYSWITAVRVVWKDGTITPVDVGPWARLYVTSLQPSAFGPGNGVLKVTLPRAREEGLPKAVEEEMTFEWKVPRKSTTIYRLWARAFNMLMNIHAAWENITKALELVKTGKTETSRPWIVPRGLSRGYGFIEAPRGSLRHWVIQRGGRTLNVQVIAPTTVNASTQDKWGLSPFEESVARAWISEEVSPDEWQGLDFVRSIRSFDPCLPCAAHIQIVGNGRIARTISRMITSQPSCDL